MPCRETNILLSLCILAGGLLCLPGCKGDHAAAKAKWQDKANWQQIRPGMNTEQVRAVLGEPTNIQSNPAIIRWSYGEGEKGGTVMFFPAGTIKSWHAPD